MVPPGPLWAVSGLPFVGVVLALFWFWTPPPALVGLLLPAPCGSAPPGPALPAPVPACGGPGPGLGFCPGCALVSSVPSPLAGGSSCRGALCNTLSLSLSAGLLLCPWQWKRNGCSPCYSEAYPFLAKQTRDKGSKEASCFPSAATLTKGKGRKRNQLSAVAFNHHARCLLDSGVCLMVWPWAFNARCVLLASIW